MATTLQQIRYVLRVHKEFANENKIDGQLYQREKNVAVMTAQNLIVKSKSTKLSNKTLKWGTTRANQLNNYIALFIRVSLIATHLGNASNSYINYNIVSQWMDKSPQT